MPMVEIQEMLSILHLARRRNRLATCVIISWDRSIRSL